MTSWCLKRRDKKSKSQL